MAIKVTFGNCVGSFPGKIFNRIRKSLAPGADVAHFLHGSTQFAFAFLAIMEYV